MTNCGVCARLYADYPSRQCRYASLSGIECGAAFFGASAESDVCHHCHGDYQHDTRPGVHLRFRLGHSRAAIATIVAQVISLIWQLRIFSNKDELLHFHRGIFRLKRKIVFDSLAIGMSPFLMNMAACFIVILINQGLKKYGGDLAIGAFGIVNRLVFIIVMIVMGLNQGMQPIAGYNFGAGQHARVIKTLKLTIIYATCVTTFGFIVGMLFSDWVVSIFTSDAELIALSAKGLRIVVMIFPHYRLSNGYRQFLPEYRNGE